MMTIDTLFALIIVTFATSWFSGIVGMGGGIILLAVMTVIVPIELLIPLHALLIVGNNLTRSFLMRRYIHRQLFSKFFFGILIGVAVGVHVNVSMPQNTFMLLLGVAMLLMVWLPKIKWIPKVHEGFFGFFHAALATVFGSGGVLQATFARLDLTKHARIATFTCLMLCLNVFKAAGFSLYGTNVLPLFYVALLCLPGAFLGSHLGKVCLDKLPENVFKLVFKIIVSLLAVRLIVVALLGF